MNSNDPIAKVVQDLRSRGYINTFSIQDSAIYCTDLAKNVAPEDVTIVEQHHVSGPEADAANTHEIYAVTTPDHVMGIMLDTYAQYNAAEFAALFSKVHNSKPAEA